jgi:hypothetical protein
VETSRGGTLLYCIESPENWFEDFGEGRLVDGKAHVELDPQFLETVTVNAANPMKVFVQLDDENAAGLRVKRGLTGFDVEKERSNATFWYRVVAKRRGYELRRLEECPAAKSDPYLHPELRSALCDHEQRFKRHRDSRDFEGSAVQGSPMLMQLPAHDREEVGEEEVIIHPHVPTQSWQRINEKKLSMGGSHELEP